MPVLARYQMSGTLVADMANSMKRISSFGAGGDLTVKMQWILRGRTEMIQLKSRREMNLMRQAGFLVWEAHQIVGSMIRPGVTTKELDTAVDQFLVEHNAIPLFKGFPGPVPFPAATCISINEEVVHGIPGNRKLVNGDIVSIDIGAKLNGWCGDAAVTYAVGHVDIKTRLLMDVTQDVLRLAITLLGVKSHWSEVVTEMEAYLKNKKYGFSTVEVFTGHGIGREMHEDPAVPNFVTQSDFRLEPGLVIAIEPMINMGSKQVRRLGDQWTQVTVDGKPSAHFEHTIALTKDGPWVLTKG